MTKDIIREANLAARKVADAANEAAEKVAKAAELAAKPNGAMVAVIANDISYIKSDIGEIKSRLDHNYISREEFDPIKRLVYGLVALILVAVVGSLMTLVVRR